MKLKLDLGEGNVDVLSADAQDGAIESAVEVDAGLVSQPRCGQVGQRR